MIIATLATYPPRVNNIETVIQAISPQVDRLRVVLNQFNEIPEIFRKFQNVEPIIPTADTKDTGKFLLPVDADDWLFTIDDDIYYPSNYVTRSIAALEAAGMPGAIGGYHGSIYTRHKYLNSRPLRRFLGRNENFIVGQRRIIGFSFEQSPAMIVDQLGTGVTLMKGRDAPPFDKIAHAQKFVDVAAARWWFENGRTLVCLPRPAEWITERPPEGETIVGSFTSQRPRKVADEIYGFAYKNPRVGTILSGVSVSRIHGN